VRLFFDKVAVDPDFLTVSSCFPPCCILNDDLLLRCAITPIRHNIITSPAFKFGLNVWHSGFRTSKLDIACILLGIMGSDEI